MYTGKEFADMKVREPAERIGGVLAVVLLAYFFKQGTSLKPLLTLTEKAPWVWDITVMGYFLKVSQDVREQVAGMYWAKALVVTAIAGFGGGFLAPLLVCHLPVPLMEEAYAWFCILAWYVTHHVPYVSATWADVTRSKTGWVVLTVLFGIFKTNQIFGSIELAAKAIPHETLLPHSRYFAVPCAAPLLCGFLGGCGGAFLPFDKGMRPVEEGKQWPVCASFFCTLIYYFATRNFGMEQLDAKMLICILRIMGDLFPQARGQVVSTVTSVLYSCTNVRGSKPADSKV